MKAGLKNAQTDLLPGPVTAEIRKAWELTTWSIVCHDSENFAIALYPSPCLIPFHQANSLPASLTLENGGIVGIDAPDGSFSCKDGNLTCKSVDGKPATEVEAEKMPEQIMLW